MMKREESKQKRSLNPCCNGIYLMIYLVVAIKRTACLNPCCNGIYLMMELLETLLKKMRS